MSKQLNLYIDENVDSMFRSLASEDIRSLSMEFEYLVWEEFSRRQEEETEPEEPSCLQ